MLYSVLFIINSMYQITEDELDYLFNSLDKVYNEYQSSATNDTKAENLLQNRSLITFQILTNQNKINHLLKLIEVNRELLVEHTESWKSFKEIMEVK